MTDKLICNICIEPIEEDSLDTSLVRLSCVPDKHYFCRKCIIDWYKEILQKNNGNSEYKNRMCPLCRGNGGYIQQLKGEKYLKGIHTKLEVKKKDYSIINQCKYIINGDRQCSRSANKNYKDYCSQHHLVVNKNNLGNLTNHFNNINNINNTNNNNNNINNINNTNNLNNTNNESKIIQKDLSELEQFEMGFEEVKNIYDDYYIMWNNYSNEDKMKEKLRLFEILEMLKEQILTLMNIISGMMEENNDDTNILKLIDNQYKTLQLEEDINVLENELILFELVEDNNYQKNNSLFNELNENLKENQNFFDEYDCEINNNLLEQNKSNLDELFKDLSLQNNINLNLNQEQDINNDLENLKIVINNTNVKTKSKTKKIKKLK